MSWVRYYPKPCHKPPACHHCHDNKWVHYTPGDGKEPPAGTPVYEYTTTLNPGHWLHYACPDCNPGAVPALGCGTRRVDSTGA